MDTIIIGTRGSQLSLKQTDIIKNQLQALLPTVKIEVKVITTKGDVDMNPVPLDTIGKGWFTKEIDRELLKGSVDLAVHSLKDLPEILPKGLSLSAIPQREDAREALVTKNGITFEKLKYGAIIGTDSIRRKIQILHKRKDLVVRSIRGNVNTRLAKLDSQEYDGIFLAVAGLKRLGLAYRISQYFSVTDFIPSPGQGALAIVIKKNNRKLQTLVKKLNHVPTVCSVMAEREFSHVMGGGCKLPVGAYAVCEGTTITIHGFVGSLDGKHRVTDSIKGDITKSSALGNLLATRLLGKSKRWYRISDTKYIVVTRQKTENVPLQKKLEEAGLAVFSYPCIRIIKNVMTVAMKKSLSDLSSYDRILFTSQSGVHFFMKILADMKINNEIMKKKWIGAVGPKTAETLKRYHLPVHFIPTKFTTSDLGLQMRDVKGKKILLPRSSIATTTLTKLLCSKGAKVIDIPIYKTLFVAKYTDEFDFLVQNNQIQGIIFTSPSTVEAFLQSVKDDQIKKKIFTIPIFSIGPITTKRAKRRGFKTIISANTFTIDGILTKLKESTL